MPFGKNAEEKTAAAAEKAYWNSPVGQAAKAKIDGDTFFQLAIRASTITGRSSDLFGPRSTSNTQRTKHAPDLLGRIEDLGWHLEHVGYVFVETGISTRGKMLSKGEQGTTSGYVEGIYLFRNVNDPDALDPTVPQIAETTPA